MWHVSLIPLFCKKVLLISVASTSRWAPLMLGSANPIMSASRNSSFWSIRQGPFPAFGPEEAVHWTWSMKWVCSPAASWPLQEQNMRVLCSREKNTEPAFKSVCSNISRTTSQRGTRRTARETFNSRVTLLVSHLFDHHSRKKQHQSCGFVVFCLFFHLQHFVFQKDNLSLFAVDSETTIVAKRWRSLRSWAYIWFTGALYEFSPLLEI